MLKINLETSINNLNYINYMQYKDSENGENKRILESERATTKEKNKQKNIFS